MQGALTRYRVMAFVTGVFLLFMTGWLVLGYTLWGYSGEGVKPSAYVLMWTGHGYLYAAYLVTGVDLAFRCRWGVLRTLAVLVAGTIPFMSFVAEHYVTRDVRARLAAAQEAADQSANPEPANPPR
ncbi:MAG: DUF3817 domain-containing protein [Candidatus Nanopelagicales bacterium]